MRNRNAVARLIPRRARSGKPQRSAPLASLPFAFRPLALLASVSVTVFANGAAGTFVRVPAHVVTLKLTPHLPRSKLRNYRDHSINATTSLRQVDHPRILLHSHRLLNVLPPLSLLSRPTCQHRSHSTRHRLSFFYGSICALADSSHVYRCHLTCAALDVVDVATIA